MIEYLTPAQLLARQQRDRRMVQRIVGFMALLWLGLVITMITGWELSW